MVALRSLFFRRLQVRVWTASLWFVQKNKRKTLRILGLTVVLFLFSGSGGMFSCSSLILRVSYPVTDVSDVIMLSEREFPFSFPCLCWSATSFVEMHRGAQTRTEKLPAAFPETFLPLRKRLRNLGRKTAAEQVHLSHAFASLSQRRHLLSGTLAFSVCHVYVPLTVPVCHVT